MSITALFRKSVFGAALSVGLVAVAAGQPALACTGIMLKTEDGAIVHGRTVEFGFEIDSEIALVPRGFGFVGQTPLGDGYSWTGKYAVLGTLVAGTNAVLDGINEKGLAVGVFYFPTFAGYTETTEENRAKSLSPTDFNDWMLTNFATVDEVRAAVESGEVLIAPTVVPGGPPGVQPFHYIVYDKSGKSLVIEPVDGTLKLYDNPIGTLTNSPPFDWHMTNLRNYIALSPYNVPPVDLDGARFQQLGEGIGMLGLPGDFTPPSRFVRAAVFSGTAKPAENAEKGVNQVFHILNNFDIPVGATRAKIDGSVQYEYTMLTMARDPQALKYYWKSYDDQTIRSADMNAFDLDGDRILLLSTKSQQPVVDMSKDFK